MRRKGITVADQAGRRRRNQQMIDLGADVILALAPRESADLATDLHYARAAQIPVREAHSPERCRRTKVGPNQPTLAS